MNKELFDKGLAVRKEVLGKEYVENSLKSADEFMMAFQEITTEYCWGYVWDRPGLDRKTRSCTVYEARPHTCRGYPYGARCGYYEFLKFEREHQADESFVATT